MIGSYSPQRGAHKGGTHSMEHSSFTEHEYHLLEHLKTLWKLPEAISPDIFQSIVEMLLHFQEPYKTIGLRKIAEYLVSTINIHLLSLLALFQHKAAREGINEQEQAETLAQVGPDMFRVLDRLSTHLSLSSLDDLVVLSTIVLSLQTLSQTESAQEAQSWLYELPTICSQQLLHEHLLVDSHHVVFTSNESAEPATDQVHGFYQEYMQNTIYIKPEQLSVSLPRHRAPGVSLEQKQEQGDLPYIA